MPSPYYPYMKKKKKKKKKTPDRRLCFSLFSFFYFGYQPPWI